MLHANTNRFNPVPWHSRRSEERFKVTAAVSFRWRTEHGDWREGKGITRDMSGSSLFILAYPVPVPGAEVVIRVEVPSLSALRTPIIFHGLGTVVRIEPEHGQPIGFAARVVFDEGDAAEASN